VRGVEQHIRPGGGAPGKDTRFNVYVAVEVFDAFARFPPVALTPVRGTAWKPGVFSAAVFHRFESLPAEATSLFSHRTADTASIRARGWRRHRREQGQDCAPDQEFFTTSANKRLVRCSWTDDRGGGKTLTGRLFVTCKSATVK